MSKAKPQLTNEQLRRIQNILDARLRGAPVTHRQVVFREETMAKVHKAHKANHPNDTKSFRQLQG